MKQTTNRTALLAAVLVLAVFGYFGTEVWPRIFYRPPSAAPALAGENKISRLAVAKDAKDRWIATVDYFYTGEPMGAYITVELSGDTPAKGPLVGGQGWSAFIQTERGSHQTSVALHRPSKVESSVTKSVSANIRSESKVLASVQVSQVINWPDLMTAQLESELAEKGPAALLSRAVPLIDNGDSRSLTEAKGLLERILTKDPRYVQAYVELARVAMKSNWGPEGLHQAETLISSARDIQPEDVNATILLAYVYAHQGNFGKAEALNEEVAKLEPANQWLWSNWGEALAMQGKIEPAIQKYREGLRRQRSDDSNDRARLDAYKHLLALLSGRADVAGQEALYKQRATEFGPGSCYSADYATFILKQRGDAASAIGLAREAVTGRCQAPEARTALGLGYYLAWATGSGPASIEALNQARVFLPPGPGVLYLLAGSEHTSVAVKRLLASGESIEQRDNEKMNALAYALRARDYAAARRLMQFGARRDAPIGDGDVPVAFLPVLTGDVEGVHTMQRSGVDYSKLRFRGTTAVDEVRKSGDSRMLEALDPKRGSS